MSGKTSGRRTPADRAHERTADLLHEVNELRAAPGLADLLTAAERARDEALGEAGELREQLNAVYRERAHLVAYLAAAYPSCIGPAPDAEGWAIVYVATPEQMTWHIGYRDLDLFGHVHVGLDEWDGHTTAEKYARLDKLTARKAGPAVATSGTEHLAGQLRGLAIPDAEGRS